MLGTSCSEAAVFENALQTTRCAALAGVAFNASLLEGPLALNNAINTEPDKLGGAWPAQVCPTALV